MTTNPQRATALVTGASSGIGAVYADRLARRGHPLVLVARDAERLNALAARLRAETGVSAEVLVADLTRPDALDRVAARLAEPDVGLLVNNAGMALSDTLAESTPEQVARLLALNVGAPTRLAAVAARAFALRGGGEIVNIGSVLALATERFEPAYAATKAFVLTLSQGLAATEAARGIYVQAVLPGATRTEIWARSGKDIDAFPPEMVMEVDDMVDAALAGFDARETVTIPALPDAGQWQAYEAARLAMGPNLSLRDPAARYRAAAAA
ncbi:SDR family oxidoreductase [Oceanicella sp. SM1341]|uniref:SDR family NAD(P)-dependent oxidoreductase n=1 Tax=Oceanicella sp. SM1341 TaxID=1548889 RepID=UPI000E4983B8|nr:SDR family NAD(P)-dependent oxidoreductase [Oceanicella sp. SM1341]